MSSVHKVGEGRSAKYDARWRTPDGQNRRKRFDREKDASDHLKAVDGAIVGHTYVDSAQGRVSFRECAEGWREMQMHRPSSQQHVETMLRRHAYPTLGERQIGSILPSEIQAWAKRLSVGDVDAGRKPLAPATIGVVHGLVSSVMKSAIRDKRITANPCEGTKLPVVVKKRVSPPTTEQVEQARALLPPELTALVTFAAGTGLRQGECFGLTVDRLPLLRREVIVDRQLLGVRGGVPEFGPPKTAASDRVVPLPRVVVEAMVEHTTRLDLGLDDLVFTYGGRPITRQIFGRLWRPIAREVGFPPGTGLHALRHYYASLLIRYGESVKTVQARLGHASAAETLDTYAHLWPDSDDRTREAIDAVLGAGGAFGVTSVSESARPALA